MRAPGAQRARGAVRTVAELRHRRLDAGARGRVDARAVVHDPRHRLPRHSGEQTRRRASTLASRPRSAWRRRPSRARDARTPRYRHPDRVSSGSPHPVHVKTAGMLTLPRAACYRVDVNIPVLSTEPLGAGVIKRTTRLADGRELIYFDDPGTTLGPERGIDARALDPRAETATMRRDVLTGDWISVAAGRQNRAFLPPAELDPLAPQTPTNPSEIPSLLRRRGVREPLALVRSGARRTRTATRPPPSTRRWASTTSTPRDSAARARPSGAARSCASAPSTRARSARSPRPAPAP